MSACAGQDLSVIDDGMRFPGALIYVNGDDAHNDGAGKCDSIVDRWSAIPFGQATVGNRFTIATGTLPSGHKTLEGNSKSLLAVNAIASALANRHDYTEVIYFQLTSLFTESQLISFSGAGAMAINAYSTFSPSSGSKISTRNGGGLVDHNVNYARSTTGFHHLVHSYSGGVVTVYLDNVSKGTVAITAGQDPVSLDTITLGGGSHVCKFHQWAVYDAALTAPQVAISYAEMTVLAS